jgi:tetratricopeptide (TPR) repeat protein
MDILEVGNVFARIAELILSQLSRPGIAMPGMNRRPNPSGSSAIAFLAERPQIDFEIDFFESLLSRVPDYAEVLRAQACNLTAKGRVKDGLRVDQLLVTIRPHDPTAHYNLACRYAILKQRDLALQTLRRAMELGYRDFRFISQDADLETIQKDPRFRELMKEFGSSQKR